MGYTGERGGWPKVQQFVDSKLLGNSNNEKVVSRDAETQTQELETTHKIPLGLNWIEGARSEMPLVKRKRYLELWRSRNPEI